MNFFSLNTTPSTLHLIFAVIYPDMWVVGPTNTGMHCFAAVGPLPCAGRQLHATELGLRWRSFTRGVPRRSAPAATRARRSSRVASRGGPHQAAACARAQLAVAEVRASNYTRATAEACASSGACARGELRRPTPELDPLRRSRGGPYKWRS